MKQYILPAVLILSLSACGGEFKNPFEGLGKRPETTAPAASEPLSAINLPEDAVETTPLEAPASVEVSSIGQSAASLDQTTEAEKAAAKAVPTNATSQLGTTVASLGDPTEQGFWLRTPLVSEETQGSVEAEGGAVVQVKLIPIEGAASAGSRISLAAMRALGLGLTDLATLKVSRL